MSGRHAQQGPGDELGWLVDLVRDAIHPGEIEQLKPCPKAVARAHARLMEERAELFALRAVAQAAGRVVEHHCSQCPGVGLCEELDRLWEAMVSALEALSALPPARPGNGEGEG